ncbi:hypothetical protein HPB47_004179 [Ixodes persulcatus]|uniref:Uncharacterized protein n=1 Tax=Ixodes persulcatus TaxID=34615 RepID=A0AC60PGE8_IXOPE|nr:hypothetical protein HPB47_004179 [Ixodes persulcatus]
MTMSKIDIISKVEEDRKKQRVDLARELGLPVSTLNTIVGKQEEIRNKVLVFDASVKQTRGAQHAQMEEILVAWFKEVRAAGVNINGKVLREKADEIASWPTKLRIF